MNSAPQHARIRVMVVDDHALLREGLAAQLHGEPGMLLVGEADNAAAAITAAADCAPDVVLMDVDLPGLNAFSASRTLQSMHPNIRIVFLSAYDHDAYIRQALEVKAWGYLTKRESFAEVCRAIRDAFAGRVSYSADVRERIINTPTGPLLSERPGTPSAQLSEREVELLGYLAKGLATRAIAALMRISSKTVESHKASLMGKLGIHDRVDLARYAIRAGITAP